MKGGEEWREDKVVAQTFQEISPADFFYRNREIVGFTNPTRAIFSAIRELVENSLDAAEAIQVPPDIYIRLSQDEESKGSRIYTLRVEDNGSGIPSQQVPLSFGQFLVSSKYKLKQARGTFGLGGTMAILYGQITTNKPVCITSSTGGSRIFKYVLMIDIEKNRPVILDRKVLKNRWKWHGTIVEFHLEGDYSKAMPRILDYLKLTAIVNPYADITFVDPKGRLYRFERKSEEVPPPPVETLPHPHGVDVETLQRIIRSTECTNMLSFMKEHFHRVGEQTARQFLKSAGIDERMNPKSLRPDEIVDLVRAMKNFKDFLPPDASCLSPIGEELMRTGILKELEPRFTAVSQRKPSAYSGHPFIVEVAIAYGGKVPSRNDITLYRFANKIPLMYDESGDVSWKILRSINWRRYGVSPGMPVAVLVHICSTKIPYKTVGKEIIADIPEISREILNGIREVARRLRRYLMRRRHVEQQRRRLSIFSRYLPKIAEFSARLGGLEEMPDINRLYKRQVIFRDYKTGNSYVEGEVFNAEGYKTILVIAKNKHESNSVNLRVLGLTGSRWRVLIPEVTLEAGAEFYEMLTKRARLVKVQVKSAVRNKPGTVNVFIDGLSE
ncbi:DNA topoisomerase VI subunit B [Candidatus Bathyarchaeota archaeon]|nr:MAG: DNA topoisomerase VI subunit B [Candidatus Bathyarchaeota archaeon]